MGVTIAPAASFVQSIPKMGMAALYAHDPLSSPRVPASQMKTN